MTAITTYTFSIIVGGSTAEVRPRIEALTRR